MEILKVIEVSKKVSEDFELKDVSFTQQPFQKIAIAGETGSGKSTLLKIIAGYEQPDSGEVYLGDNKLRGPNYQLIPGHDGVAYLSQYYELRNWYRVEELFDMASHLSDEETVRICQLCQVDHLLERRTDQLSGGEKQRIALARLLVTSPKLLILDEPFSNTDMIHKRVLKSVIQNVSQEMNISCIMTAHDPLDILPWADELLIMKNGRVMQYGNPKEVYEQPVDEYAAGLLGSYNVLPIELAIKLELGNVSRQNKHAIVRPEKLSIADESNGVAGIIQDVRYLGSYYEVVVSVEQTTLIVFSDRSYKKGDHVLVMHK